MSNKVWVTWKTSDGAALFTMVKGLEDDAIIDELRTAFILARKWETFDPATLSVSETENGKKLEEDCPVKPYFVAGAATGPGKSKGTALFVTLPPTQDAPDTENDNILGAGVYEKLTNSVCFFQDQKGKPIGAGFAVSKKTVYSVSHNFVEPTIGMEVTCYFGKPNEKIIRNLRIASVDTQLDYCRLEMVGNDSFLDFLETAPDPLKAGKQCILAAFQIGIQDDLQELDPSLSVGIFQGSIAKLYPRHFVYQCPTFAGDSGGAIVLKNGRVIGIHQETVIQARERIQYGEDLDTDSRLESVEASVDDLIKSVSSGSIGLQLLAIPGALNV